jgi:hypothetical protein
MLQKISLPGIYGKLETEKIKIEKSINLELSYRRIRPSVLIMLELEHHWLRPANHLKLSETHVSIVHRVKKNFALLASAVAPILLAQAAQH